MYRSPFSLLFCRSLACPVSRAAGPYLAARHAIERRNFRRKQVHTSKFGQAWVEFEVDGQGCVT